MSHFRFELAAALGRFVRPHWVLAARFLLAAPRFGPPFWARPAVGRRCWIFAGRAPPWVVSTVPPHDVLPSRRSVVCGATRPPCLQRLVAHSPFRRRRLALPSAAPPLPPRSSPNTFVLPRFTVSGACLLALSSTRYAEAYLYIHISVLCSFSRRRGTQGIGFPSRPRSSPVCGTIGASTR